MKQEHIIKRIAKFEKVSRGQFEKDFLDTFAKSDPVTKEEVARTSVVKRAIQAVLRLMSPLL